MEWHAAVRMLEPFVIRVASPSGSGTGFLVSQPAVAPLCAIATAAHVIAEAQVWELPIKLEHHTSQKSVLLHHADRVIFVDAARDTAAIVFDKKSLPLGSVPPALIAEGRITKVGVEL